MSRHSVIGYFGRLVAAGGAVLLVVALFLPAFNFPGEPTYWDLFRRMDVVFLVVGVAALLLLAASLRVLRNLMLLAVAVLGGAGLGFFSADFIELDTDETTGAFLANLGSAAMVVGAAIALLPALLERSGESREPAETPETPETVAPGPGWYDDPSGQSRLRYWDGQAWTEETQE